MSVHMSVASRLIKREYTHYIIIEIFHLFYTAKSDTIKSNLLKKCRSLKCNKLF